MFRSSQNIGPFKSTRRLLYLHSGYAGITAALGTMLLTSFAAAPSFADDAEIQKELAALKAQINLQKQQLDAQKVQIRELVSGMREQSADVKKTKKKIEMVADRPASQPVIKGPAENAPLISLYDKKLHLGGITVTPGGFVAMETEWRSRSVQSEAGLTLWGAIPMHNSASGATNELRMTPRQSRFNLLIQGDISPSIEASGFIDTDFYGVGTGSNNLAVNGYLPRMRQLYSNVDFNDIGFHILAGSAWSLITPNSKGITPRNEVGMITIENQPVPGLASARQAQVRFTKDFDKKLWLSLSVEESQTAFGSGCNPIVANTGAAITPTVVNGATVTCQAGGIGGYAQGGETTPYSLNRVPDVIGKVAYEADLGGRNVHFEAFGMYRNFYDRVTFSNGTGTSDSTNAFSGGGAALGQIIPNKLDFIVQTLMGRGIGRYGPSGLGDATIATNGSILPLRGLDLFGGLIFHPTSQIDIYGYGGYERLFSSYTQTAPGTYLGYGLPNANDTGCNTEGSALCTGNTSNVWQLTGGIWDRVYEGPFGAIRIGVQYSYTKRTLFGSSDGPGSNYIQPSADDHMFLTSLRYYPF